MTTTLRYILGWIPLGLSSSCVVDSLCQTMKWISAGAVEGVHGMLFPGCGHISHGTASLIPFPFVAVFAAKVHTHSPTLPLVSSLHQIQFLLLHTPCRAQITIKIACKFTWKKNLFYKVCVQKLCKNVLNMFFFQQNLIQFAWRVLCLKQTILFKKF